MWRRGWRGLARYPLARLARMAMLTVAAGVAAVAVLRGTTPAIVGDGRRPVPARPRRRRAAVAGDRPPGSQRRRARTSEVGCSLRHLAAPAVGLVPFALLGAAVVIAAEPGAWAAALVLAVPIMWLGAGGAAVSIVRDAPDPLQPPVASSAAVPPEFAGFTSTMRLLWPLAVSAIATVPCSPSASCRQPARSCARSPALRPRRWPHCCGGSAGGATSGAGGVRAFLDAGRRPSSATTWPRALDADASCRSPTATLPAVGPLDLTVTAGERVVLVGHNGSGKTTLLRMAAGLLDPSTGSITVFGRPVGSIEARAATSYLGDQPVFYDDLSLREHLEYLARLHGNDDWEEQAADLLEMLGLVERADDLPTTFSRGLRQKVAIALAFVRPFELLLVDEPFVGLDLTGRHALLELFRRAHHDGAALVVATHEMSTVAEADASSRCATAASCSTVRATAPTSMPWSPSEEPGCYRPTHVRVRLRQRLDLRGLDARRQAHRESRDGWDVVAVVPTGSDVTAFLRRAASTTESTAAPADTTSTWDAGAATTAVAAGAASEPAGWGSAPETGSWGNSHRRQLDQLVGRRRGDAGRGQHVGVLQRRPRHRPPRRRPAPAVPAGWYSDPALPLRAALLGRLGVDRARLPRRPAVHRPARRLTGSARRRLGADR